MGRQILLLGIGQMGCTVSDLIMQRINKDADLVRAIAIDTDERTLEDLSCVSCMPMVDEGSLSDVVEKLGEERVKEWFPADWEADSSVFAKNMSMRHGSGLWRMKAYLSFASFVSNPDRVARLTGVIKEFLRTHPDFCLQQILHNFGREGIDMPEVRRIFTLDGGEGHFIALLKRQGDSPRKSIDFAPKKAQKANTAPQGITDFLKQNKVTLPKGKIIAKGDRVYLCPNITPPENIGVLRVGLLLNEPNPKRFIPSHALYMCPAVLCENELDLPLSDPRVKAFLHGEEIAADGISGYTRVCVEGIPCGFGKASSGRLKNYYPKGLRTL